MRIEYNKETDRYLMTDAAVLFVAPYGQVVDKNKRFFETMMVEGLSRVLYGPAEVLKKGYGLIAVIPDRFWTAFPSVDEDENAYTAPTIEEFDFVKFAGGDESKAAEDKRRLLAEYTSWRDGMEKKDKYPEVPYVWFVGANITAHSEEAITETCRIGANLATEGVEGPLTFRVGRSRVKYCTPLCFGIDLRNVE